MRHLIPRSAGVVFLFDLVLAATPLLTHQRVCANEPPKKRDEQKTEKPARCLTFAFSGEVASFRDDGKNFDRSVRPGSKFHGFYTFDPEIRNSNPNKDK